MARPNRRLWRIRTVVRRRHRSWMLSMSLATLGWGVWWAAVVLHRSAPGLAPSAGTTYAAACTVGALGLLIALFTIRGQPFWLGMTMLPLFANATLLALPWLLPGGGGLL